MFVLVFLIIAVAYLVPKVIAESEHKNGRNNLKNIPQFKIMVGVIVVILVLTCFIPILGALVGMAIVGFAVFVFIANLLEN